MFGDLSQKNHNPQAEEDSKRGCFPPYPDRYHRTPHPRRSAGCGPAWPPEAVPEFAAFAASQFH